MLATANLPQELQNIMFRAVRDRRRKPPPEAVDVGLWNFVPRSPLEQRFVSLDDITHIASKLLPGYGKDIWSEDIWPVELKEEGLSLYVLTLL